MAGVTIAFEADFAPFQPWLQKAVKARNMGPTYQFSHTKDKVAGYRDMPGSIKMDTSNDESQYHTIFSFVNQILALPAGEYKVENGKIVSQKESK